MIFRVLFKFTENQVKNQYFKEHKLLTINMLIIIKDQLITFVCAIRVDKPANTNKTINRNCFFINN